MRICCFCISLRLASAFLALLGIALSLASLRVLLPYVLPVNAFPQSWDLVSENINFITFQLKAYLENRDFDEDDIKTVISSVVESAKTILSVEAVLNVFYLVVCVLMLIGVKRRSPLMMRPYLIYQALIIFVYSLFCISFSALVLYVDVVTGLVALAVLVSQLLFLLYLYRAVYDCHLKLEDRKRREKDQREIRQLYVLAPTSEFS